MLTGIRKLFYYFTNSIGKKLTLCFLAIIIVLVSASSYTYYSGKALNDLYNSALEKHLLFNDIFVNLGNTNELLGKYLKSESPHLYVAYTKQYPLLQKSVQDLEVIMNYNSYVRETIDLKYMIQSYIEEANQAVDLIREHNLEGTSKHYNSAENIIKLVNQSFKEVYSIILNDTSNMKIKVIDNRQRLYTFNGILIAIAGLGCLFFTQWFSRTLTRPIKKLTAAAAQISNGDMNMHMAEVSLTTHDEISILTSSFNKMVNKIEFQITEIKEKSELERKFKDEEISNLKTKNLLKKSELRSMQSRINHHFLFNSLNMISKMAYIEEAAQTNSMLDAMSDLLRYNLDKFNKLVRIEDEINNIKDYIYIQTMRFGNRISFIINDTKAGNNGIIPCLIIQPLVENSIIHGVETYIENGIVKISIEKVEDRIFIKVYDNGIGIEEKKMKILNNIISSVSRDNISEDTEGIGLINVFSRLKLLYNGDVKIKIDSEQGRGTEFMLDIPYKIEESNNV